MENGKLEAKGRGEGENRMRSDEYLEFNKLTVERISTYLKNQERKTIVNSIAGSFCFFMGLYFIAYIFGL